MPNWGRPRRSYGGIVVKKANTDILYFEIGPENSPTLTVSPGEAFQVQTQMNRGPWIEKRANTQELKKQLIGGNPSSGCIYIEGAKPGDMLTVEIGKITLSDFGFTSFSGSNGALPSYFGIGPLGSHYRGVEIRDNHIIWNEKLRIPASPMIGYVGVSPSSERYHNGWAGYWGGNFDIQEITTGARVHLPVFVEGALLHVGDMHAIQGDGEICGAGGIETEGLVEMTCSVAEKPADMHYPRVENDTHMLAVGLAKPAEDAFRQALEVLILWIEERYGVEHGEAYMLLAQVMEARCTQFVNPSFTYVAKAAKKYFE